MRGTILTAAMAFLLGVAASEAIKAAQAQDTVSKVQRVTPTIKTVETDASGIEARLERLEQTLEIDEKTGDIAIRSSGAISIEAVRSLTLSGLNATLEGAASTQVGAAGTTEITGALVKINGGGRALARVGDPVTTPMGPGTIVGTGSPNVFVP